MAKVSSPTVPVPSEHFSRCFCDLEPFADPQALDPEDLAANGCRQHERVPPFARNSLVHKQVLELCRMRHADGLKPIASAPMPQDNPIAHRLCIEEFRVPGPASGQFGAVDQPPLKAF